MIQKGNDAVLIYLQKKLMEAFHGYFVYLRLKIIRLNKFVWQKNLEK